VSGSSDADGLVHSSAPGLDVAGQCGHRPFTARAQAVEQADVQFG
jgi:hypothetical protein